MDTPDCKTMSDADLMDHYRAVLVEVERRQQFRAIPGQIAAMTTQYLGDGGKRDDLKAAVEKAPAPDETSTPPPPPPADTTSGSKPASGATASTTLKVGG